MRQGSAFEGLFGRGRPEVVNGLTLPQLWALTAVALFAIKAWFSSSAGVDFWWHLAMGHDILHSGIPHIDTYSWTQGGQPFFDHNWLAEIGFYVLYRVGGLALMGFLNGVAVLSMGWLMFKACRRRTASLRTIAFVLLVFVGLGSISNWAVRPQTFVFPMFAAFLLLLGPPRRYRAQTHWLWTLPAMMVLWVNWHGSFVLGVFLVGAAMLGDLVDSVWKHRTLHDGWQLAPVFVATAAATLVNPHGARVYGYVSSLTSNDTVRSMLQEWARPNLSELSGWTLAVAAATLVGSFLVGRARPEPQDLIVVGGLLPLALLAQRNIVWFCVAAAPLAASQLDRRARQTEHEQPAPGSVIFVLGLIALSLLSLPWVRTELLQGRYRSLSEPRPTAAALTVVDATAPNRLFNDMSYGGYLMFAAPHVRVFIDPRVELYTGAQVRDYARLINGVDVDELIAKYNFDAMLLSVRKQPRLVRALARDSSWHLAYADDESRYYTKSTERASGVSR